jgi:hypothetical protein
MIGIGCRLSRTPKHARHVTEAAKPVVVSPFFIPISVEKNL